jgi:histidine phosphotransfer protein HptB
VSQRVDIELDWDQFDRIRVQLGTGFMRVFGYFQEDGEKAVATIEEAVRTNNAAAIVLPANKLKCDAGDFGATALESLAEDIEFQARDCVEWRVDTRSIIEHVVKLRPLFEATIEEVDASSNPLARRREPRSSIG